MNAESVTGKRICSFEHQGVEVRTLEGPSTRVGKTSTVTAVIRNHRPWPIRLFNESIRDSEAKIESYTKNIPANGTGTITISVSPSLDRIDPIFTEIHFDVEIG